MRVERAVPAALLRGFGRVWTALAGGAIEEIPIGQGTLFVWNGREALPDRMYGIAGATGELDPGLLPRGLGVNLPPGLRAGGEVRCVTHLLRASTRGEAWDQLRRVGRQGVRKAERSGCEVGALEDREYLRLATLKARALEGPEPHPGLVPALREAFGAERVQLSGVRYEGAWVAAVLAIDVEGYGLLVDGASDRAHWDKNPNNLAVWAAVAALVDAGCGVVDYGFSPVGAGDARFKDHMGGREVALERVET